MKYIQLTIIGYFMMMTSYAQKPILPDFHTDPSAHYWDQKYWIYPSTDEIGSSDWSQMKRWHSYSSKDLIKWTNEGEIFNLDDVTWANNSAFAPDAMKWKGKYYFFFPAEFKIGVAMSDKPNGPFIDALGKPLIEQEAIDGVLSFDPCIFIDDDNTPYLYYGGGNGVAVARLAESLTQIEGDLIKLDLKNYHEGIWVHKKENMYYFSYPTMIERDGKKKQLLVYSTAPTPLGPFTYRGEIFDNNSRNSHHSIIKIKDKWYLFYHIEGPSPYERMACVDYLEYEKDGTIKKVTMTKAGITSIK